MYVCIINTIYIYIHISVLVYLHTHIFPREETIALTKPNSTNITRLRIRIMKIRRTNNWKQEKQKSPPILGPY